MGTKKVAMKPVINDDTANPELLASSIISVAESARKLLNSKLTMRAIVVLIKDDCGINITEIEAVLRSASQLDRRYTK